MQPGAHQVESDSLSSNTTAGTIGGQRHEAIPLPQPHGSFKVYVGRSSCGETTRVIFRLPWALP